MRLGGGGPTRHLECPRVIARGNGHTRRRGRGASAEVRLEGKTQVIVRIYGLELIGGTVGVGTGRLRVGTRGPRPVVGCSEGSVCRTGTNYVYVRQGPTTHE